VDKHISENMLWGERNQLGVWIRHIMYFMNTKIKPAEIVEWNA